MTRENVNYNVEYTFISIETDHVGIKGWYLQLSEVADTTL